MSSDTLFSWWTPPPLLSWKPLYNTHPTLYTVKPLYNTHPILYTVKPLHNTHPTLYTVRPLYSTHPTLYTVKHLYKGEVPSTYMCGRPYLPVNLYLTHTIPYIQSNFYIIKKSPSICACLPVNVYIKHTLPYIQSNLNMIIIIICRNRHSYKRGWMPHKREAQMVCNLNFPTGTTYFRIVFEFGIEGHFRRENLTSSLVG